MTTSEQERGKSLSCARQISRFSYDSFSVAKLPKGRAERIRRDSASTIHVGKGLIAAKHYLSHRHLIRWVQDEVGISARTAPGYMRIAHWIAGKSAPIAYLPPAVLYLLSAPRPPKEFASDFVQRVEKGEHLSMSVMPVELKALQRGEKPKTAHGTERDANGDGTIAEVVAILARRLPKFDFTRVRAIMTSGAVLSDAGLVQTITSAFSNTPRPNKKSRNAKRQSSLAA
jgi:hypothetical protein